MASDAGDDEEIRECCKNFTAIDELSPRSLWKNVIDSHR